MSDKDADMSSYKFELEESLRGASDNEILDDLRRSAVALGKTTITMAEYNQVGKGHSATVQRRFGSWPKALQLSGLAPSRSRIGISDEELFDNIKEVWIKLGRQPRYTEMRSPISSFSAGTYENRFGSWSKSLREFILWVNTPSLEKPETMIDAELDTHIADIPTGVAKRRTRREIGERQRFRILLRDGFRCKACGASPLTTPGTNLHVDHILPWSKGGETTDDNLGAKCERCNLAKGNAFVG